METFCRAAFALRAPPNTVGRVLHRRGKIQFLDPVSRYLPEFKGVQVGVEKLNTTTGNSELIGEPLDRK
jgi:hypothetical protein